MSDTAQMCATAPAQSIGLGERKGKIALGYDADLAMLKSDFSVAQTIVNGQIVLAKEIQP